MPDKVAEIFVRDPREPYNVLYVYGPASETEKYADRIHTQLSCGISLELKNSE